MSEFIKTPLYKKPNKGEIIFAICAICAGLALIVGISVYGVITMAKLRGYISVTGTVIDYKISTSSSTSSSGLSGGTATAYAEIAQFQVDGVTYTVTNGISSTSGVKGIGEPVQLAYNPDPPQDCIFITSNNKAGLIVAGVMGIALTLFGAVMIISYRVSFKEWQKENDCD